MVDDLAEYFCGNVRRWRTHSYLEVMMTSVASVRCSLVLSRCTGWDSLPKIKKLVQSRC